jgi:aldehyde dehydrogenase (NAD+)
MAFPDATRFYVGGEWVAPNSDRMGEIVNPATTEAIAQIALGNARDAERAILAARGAFDEWSQTPIAERLRLLNAINVGLKARSDEIGDAISAEMGAPIGLARGAQAGSGPQHFEEVIRLLETFEFERPMGTTLLRREPIGVATLITPWNWPMNQIATKVAPALAAGCTMVLKPSELAPLGAVILAEIIDEAGVPAGVFNLIHGTGEDLGDTLTGHPQVDMVSFTGSTRAGIAIGENAAQTVKRVALELGGKSANIILPGADFARAVPESVRSCMLNSGQSCNAPTRLLVPHDRLDEVCDLARETAQSLTVGMPADDPDLGPVANEAQYRRVITMIEGACDEGARLIAGGAGKPGDLPGYFVEPTVFAEVTPEMRIAREEVFGPVLAIIAYEDVDQAIAIANDSPYGLSGYVWGGSRVEANRIAARMRTGMVHVNGAGLDSAAPFGGYKMSGNGREWGKFGLEEFLELKSVYGGAEIAE